VTHATPSPSLPLAHLLQHTADAVQAVRDGRSLTDVLAQCPPAARAGTQALSFHALRWLGGAQAVRAKLAVKTPPAPVDALLVTAIALLWPEGPPPYADHTLVDQAVHAARQRAAASAGFVNAVLRRFLRERDAVVAAVQTQPQAAFQHPLWWIERVRSDWPAQWQNLLRGANLKAPMVLRVNARRGTAPAYVERLAALGMAARVVEMPGGAVRPTQAVRLAEPRPVQQLPGFEEGEVSVQDAAAQLAAPLLLGNGFLGAGARVLDACAAPGGKTSHLLELADLDVLALDSDALRLQRVQETLNRMQFKAQLQVADARDTRRWWDGRPFDAILLDAPCTASGIVRRHPDVRWLRRAEDLVALSRVQSELLDALWLLLKPGGRLLYATCSIFKAEGQGQIDAFLQRQPAAVRAGDPPSPGHLLPLPDNGSDPPSSPSLHDGFFYTLLQKH
jgi:16S rRNA (cytosine967-C5)-methyltransferase